MLLIESSDINHLISVFYLLRYISRQYSSDLWSYALLWRFRFGMCELLREAEMHYAVFFSFLL